LALWESPSPALLLGPRLQSCQQNRQQSPLARQASVASQYVSVSNSAFHALPAHRELSANRLALDLGVPSGRITDILNGRRSITADTAVRLGRYFGIRGQFWLDLQNQYDISVIQRERGAETAKRVRPADAA
jgi:antitoxin HigA-1